MKAGNGDHFEQAYNAQAAVEVESRLIVAPRVSDAPNDKGQLPLTAAAIPVAVVESVGAVLVDNGFYSEEAVQGVEADGKTVVYAAVEKTGHHRSVADLEKKAEPPPPGGGERDGGHAASSEHTRRESEIQTAATNGGASVWDHQRGDGVSTIFVTRVGESGTGVDAGVPGIQPQTAASDGNCGGGGLKGCRGSVLRSVEVGRDGRRHDN